MAKVTPIMEPGSGKKELEDCPPLNHFELTAEELSQLFETPTPLHENWD